MTAETYCVSNALSEARRARLDSVTSGMPKSLWALVILGGLITLTATLFFDTPSFRMHFWMTSLLSTLSVSWSSHRNPGYSFQGKVSIGSGSMERVYEQLMTEHTSAADGVLSKHAVDVQTAARPSPTGKISCSIGPPSPRACGGRTDASSVDRQPV